MVFFVAGCWLPGRCKTCGSQLAEECGGSDEMAATARSRSRASALLQWICVGRDSASCAQPVGAGLLAKAVGQARWTPQTDRVRGQARSYIGSASNREIAVVRRTCVQRVGKSEGLRITCGSQLADECGGSGEMDATDRSRSRASALLQWVCVEPGNRGGAQNLCPACGKT